MRQYQQGQAYCKITATVIIKIRVYKFRRFIARLLKNCGILVNNIAKYIIMKKSDISKNKSLIWCISVKGKYGVLKHFHSWEKEGIKIQGKFPYNEYNRYEMYQKH